MTQQENSAIATALRVPITGYIIELLKERDIPNQMTNPNRLIFLGSAWEEGAK
jgi:hypothetical protein